MANNRDSVIFYQRQIQICRQFLSTEQFGLLMEALFDLDDGGDPEIGDDEMVAMAFAFMSLQQRIDKDKYDRIVERNKINGSKGGAPKGNQNARKQPKTTQNKPNEKKNEKKNDNDKRGQAPVALSVLQSYVREKRLDVDVDVFWNYYEENDWVKKNGQPVTDWKKTLATWAAREKRHKKETVPATIEPPKYKEFEPEPEIDAVPMPDDVRKKMEDLFS